MDARELRGKIEGLLERPEGIRLRQGLAIDEVVAALDEGRLRVCEPVDGKWVTMPG